MNLAPRVDALEDVVDEQAARQQRLDEAISALRGDLEDTERRLTDRVDERFGQVDAHLSAQDERLDKLVDARRTWPQGAVIFVTGAVGVASGVLIYALAHALRLL